MGGQCFPTAFYWYMDKLLKDEIIVYTNMIYTGGNVQ